MKIALYLGSFNPFHNGHLEVVKTALNDFKMDKVVIVPTMQNPWKKEKVLDIDKRIEIINIFVNSSDIVIGHYIDGYYEKYDHGKWIEEEVPIFLDERTYIDSIKSSSFFSSFLAFSSWFTSTKSSFSLFSSFLASSLISSFLGSSSFISFDTLFTSSSLVFSNSSFFSSKLLFKK